MDNQFISAFKNSVKSFRADNPQSSFTIEEMDKINLKIAEFVSNFIQSNTRTYSLFHIAQLPLFDELNEFRVNVFDSTSPIIPAIHNTVADLVATRFDISMENRYGISGKRFDDTVIIESIDQMIVEEFNRMMDGKRSAVEAEAFLSGIARYLEKRGAGNGSVNGMLIEECKKDMMDYSTRYFDSVYVQMARSEGISNEPVEFSDEMTRLYGELTTTVVGLERNLPAAAYFATELMDEKFKLSDSKADRALRQLVLKFNVYAQADKAFKERLATIVPGEATLRDFESVFRSATFKRYVKAMQDFTVNYENLIALVNQNSERRKEEFVTGLLTCELIPPGAGGNRPDFNAIMITPVQILMRLGTVFGELARKNGNFSGIAAYMVQLAVQANEAKRTFERLN